MSSSLREQLLGIRQRNGKLTPEIIVEEARDPQHPLHARFEWDDSVAAEKWRREQASELIRSVKVSYTPPNGRPRELRAFHSVRSPAGYVYDPAEEIAQDPVTSRLLLQDMEREWRQLKERWSGFSEFAELVRRDMLGDTG